jgi:ectoine hydroxylase-related dioxygenase (phytanoyl-CoA dioxygenase family)
VDSLLDGARGADGASWRLARPTSAPTAVSHDRLEPHRARLDRDGYTILERALGVDLCDALVATIERLEHERSAEPGTDAFRGFNTVRLFNLLAYDAIFQRPALHEDMLALVEHVVGPEPLLGQMAAVTIGPGETAQPIHSDDMYHGNLPRPHIGLACNVLVALCDFTDANGATRIIPGSHLYPEVPPTSIQEAIVASRDTRYATVPAEMAKGSMLVINGSLLHGGGANRTGARRPALIINHCAGWVRPYDNHVLGLPLELVATFPRRLQEMCGFGTYRNFLGRIESRNPLDLVFEAVGETPPEHL